MKDLPKSKLIELAYLTYQEMVCALDKNKKRKFSSKKDKLIQELIISGVRKDEIIKSAGQIPEEEIEKYRNHLQEDQTPLDFSKLKSRIMYIERKADQLTGDARIGRVHFSKTGKTLYYKDLVFKRFKGFKSNYIEVNSDEDYWISGPRKDGDDRLYGERLPVEIDEDVKNEYWAEVRKK